MTLAPVVTVEVRTHLADFSAGMSNAALVQCDDGQKYVIKPAKLGRALVAEHVVGRLGRRIGAPCMEVAFAQVQPALIALDPKLARFAGGIAHATVYVPNVIEHRGVQHAQFPQNRERFVRLLILYSWMLASDHQFMYELTAPHLVHSHDHGLFFAGNHHWTEHTLGAATAVQLDPVLSTIGFAAWELKEAIRDLRTVTELEIAEATGWVPADWNVPVADLTALTDYLRSRRTNFLAMIDGMP